MSNSEQGAAISSSRARKRTIQQDSDRDSKSVDAITIDVRDDDDEIQIVTSTPTSQVVQNRRIHKRAHAADGASRLDSSGDTALLAGGTGPDVSFQKAARGLHSRVPRSSTIDLTCDDSPVTSGKRKGKKVSPEVSKDVQLTCTICMDTMKEETSTICGHIFCRPCILQAIKTQRKCPTCRRKLANNSIHRIYLSSGTK